MLFFKQLTEKDAKAEQRGPKTKKKAGSLSELDSLCGTLIVWFSLHTQEPTHFWGSHVQNHTCRCNMPPQQNWSWAKVTSFRKPKVPLHDANKSFLGNRHVGWSTEMVLQSRSVFFFFGRIEGGARQKAPPSLENGRLCNTASLSHRKVRLTFQKSASAAPGPHKDDTSPPLQSHASDPFYTHTQLSKNTRQFFRHNGTEAHCAAKGQQPPVPAVFNRNSMLLKFFYVQPRFRKKEKEKKKEKAYFNMTLLLFNLTAINSNASHRLMQAFFHIAVKETEEKKQRLKVHQVAGLSEVAAGRL